MVVDAHAHVVVPGLGADVRWEDGAQVVDFEGRSIRSAVREFVDLERILEEQDRAGVDMVVLCPWVTLLGREPVRQNEALAAMVGERVAALGTVDLERPEELVALMSDGRLSGVEVAASFDGDYLGAQRFADFWAAAEETEALVFIHPTTRGFDQPVFDDFYLWNAVGNPLETTITAAHMVMAGVLERHPGWPSFDFDRRSQAVQRCTSACAAEHCFAAFGNIRSPAYKSRLRAKRLTSAP